MYVTKFLYLCFLCACDLWLVFLLCLPVGGIFWSVWVGVVSWWLATGAPVSNHLILPAYVPWLACSLTLDCMPTVDSELIVLQPVASCQLAQLHTFKFKMLSSSILCCSLKTNSLTDPLVWCLLLGLLSQNQNTPASYGYSRHGLNFQGTSRQRDYAWKTRLYAPWCNGNTPWINRQLWTIQNSAHHIPPV